MDKRVVAVDLDGVLARYEDWKGLDHIGEPLPGAVEFTKRLSAFAEVLIFTSRSRHNPDGRGELGYAADDDPRPPEMLRQLVATWLDRHGFFYGDIWIGQGKPLCSALIDDRAVACEPQVFKQSAYDEAVFRTKMLCGVVERQER